ncbi:hypothetical protein PoB_006025100 [Plakobranchus ocellatus]|uniref:Uncharacterized protein n=1 Tax=Plakobranchus ocellatus TaxID=259542 RepID=A0AAV4CPD8_9GAST|nr:hypothetical protein PoB_006025100 [Plakobranchus ocellatus]
MAPGPATKRYRPGLTTSPSRAAVSGQFPAFGQNMQNRLFLFPAKDDTQLRQTNRVALCPTGGTYASLLHEKCGLNRSSADPVYNNSPCRLHRIWEIGHH